MIWLICVPEDAAQDVVTVTPDHRTVEDATQDVVTVTLEHQKVRMRVVCARKLGRCGRYGRDGSNGGSGGGGGSGHGFVRMARGQKIELTVILCGVHA